jgi:hypothetical protein
MHHHTLHEILGPHALWTLLIILLVMAVALGLCIGWLWGLLQERKKRRLASPTALVPVIKATPTSSAAPPLSSQDPSPKP